MSTARAGTYDNPPPGAPETKDILASVLNPPHQQRTKERTQTSTSTTMSPSPPSWGLGPNHGANNHIRAAARVARRGAHKPCAEFCVRVPARASSPQPCRLGIGGRNPGGHHGGRSNRRAARRGGQSAPRHTGRAGPWGPGAGRDGHHQSTGGGSDPMNDPTT